MRIVAVADGEKVSLGTALNILVARKTCPEARFTVAVPGDSKIGSNIAEDVFEKCGAEVIKIPPPQLHIGGRLYRIENKINALRYAGTEPCVLVDSDVFFVRPLPAKFLLQDAAKAVPEHGIHAFPWERLFTTIGLNVPRTFVLLGGGEVSLPWFNAGFVCCPNAEAFGEVWRMLIDYVVRCDWVPERWPYADQIALPLAMAQFSPIRTVGAENVLPGIFNQNLFYWAKDQASSVQGYVVHHHNRVGLIQRYFGQLMKWVLTEHQEIASILDAMKAYDKQAN